MRVAIGDVSVTIDGLSILTGIDMTVEPSEMVGVIGPNGSGKSTLLRTIYRALRPSAGAVHLGPDDVWRLSARESARRTAVVAQETPSDFDFSVLEVVFMGRTPHKGLLAGDSDDDWEIVARALERVGMLDKATRIFATLSGGEKQRVLLARALAQESQVLVLDEPTNHLDIKAQIELLELVRGLGVTTLAALHDLNLAATYCDRLYLMRGGTVVAAGPVADVLTPRLLADVFGVAAHCGIHPVTGCVQLAFSPLWGDESGPGAKAGQIVAERRAIQPPKSNAWKNRSISVNPASASKPSMRFSGMK
jgi:iron complex transport system ATP-binding protein